MNAWAQSFFLGCIVVASFSATRPHAADRSVVVGVNAVGAQLMNEQQEQDALIDLLQKNGVTTVRTGIGEKFTHFIIRAFQRGISAEVIVYPTQATPKGEPRPGRQVGWAAMGRAADHKRPIRRNSRLGLRARLFPWKRRACI